MEVLFAFLVIKNVLVRKGADFGFRFSYWLYYFAAHRMHHDQVFSAFILSDGRYAAYPELIEFYAGIDRRRSDAVACLITDLARMNSDFLTRTRIASNLNPFGHATWSPDQAALKQLQDEVTNSMTQSALPAAVKDAVADKQLRSGSAILPGAWKIYRDGVPSSADAGDQRCRTRASE